jgi:hypothetical protein
MIGHLSRRTGKTLRTRNFEHRSQRWRRANRRSYQDGVANRQTVSGDKRGSSNSTGVLKRIVHVIYSIPRYKAHITCLEQGQQTRYRNWCTIHSRSRFVFLLPPAQQQTRIHLPRLLYTRPLQSKGEPWVSGVPRNFVPGGVQQIQLRTEGRENGDLGAVAP